MRKKLFSLALALLPLVLFAQKSSIFQAEPAPQKYALVIGNGTYTELGRLINPMNDANDVADALQKIGFTVEKIINGTLDQMDNAVIRLKNRLSVSSNSYGFFFYAGHGIQSSGENYLIPVDANIPGESFLRSRSLPVQTMLHELNNAGNNLNVVVLDACRDNPFGWSRSGSRGLAISKYQPADSIIVYATSAGKSASDGNGRNGLFTSQLLPNLMAPGLEVSEVFKRTGAEVTEVSMRQQIPAVYNQFFGTAYLGSRPASVFEEGTANTANIATGSLKINTVAGGTVRITGTGVDQTLELPDWGTVLIEKIHAGSYHLLMRYEDGMNEGKTVEVERSETATLEFNHRPVLLPSPSPPPQIYQVPVPSIPRYPRYPIEKNPKYINPDTGRSNSFPSREHGGKR